VSIAHFKIGCLCIPTPYFIDYWIGYWVVVNIKREENLNDVYITLHNVQDNRQVTIPMHDIDNYFVVISQALGR
jgi:hypothetical protein